MEATADRVRPGHSPAPRTPDADPAAARSPLPVGSARSFADFEHAREAWNATALEAEEPLASFDLARVRTRNDAGVTDGATSRLITVSPDGERLAAAVPWTCERLRGPLACVRFAATAGATTGVLPAPILFAAGTSVADAAAAWDGMLAALDETASPDAVEIGPLPLDSAAWAGLLAAMSHERLPFRLAGSRTVGAWVRLPIDDDVPAWGPKVDRELHRLRRDLGPERAVVIDELDAVRAELHEADRMLRRSRGGGFSAVPGGRELVEGLVRAAGAGTVPGTASGAGEGSRPVAVRLEHGDRVVARAIALAGPERAVVLAVACSRDLPYRRYAPGRLVFARLATELAARGVQTIEGGPAAVWFAARCPRAVSVPLQTVLMVPRSDRRTIVEHMAGALGRLPSLGPAERFVARLRPWADALLQPPVAKDEGDEPEATEEVAAAGSPAADAPAAPAPAPVEAEAADRRDVVGRADAALDVSGVRDAA